MRQTSAFCWSGAGTSRERSPRTPAPASVAMHKGRSISARCWRATVMMRAPNRRIAEPVSWGIARSPGELVGLEPPPQTRPALAVSMRHGLSREPRASTCGRTALLRDDQRATWRRAPRVGARSQPIDVNVVASLRAIRDAELSVDVRDVELHGFWVTRSRRAMSLFLAPEARSWRVSSSRVVSASCSATRASGVRPTRRGAWAHG